MQIDQLAKTLPILQNQFDALMAFDVSVQNLNNGVINTAFAMLYRDFVKLYIIYQTAIIRLLELYFTVKQVRRAQELLDAYKKFLVRMDKVSDFMRVIDSVGIDKSDMPNLSRSPNLSLRLLENHLCQLKASSKRLQMNRMQSVELPRLGYASMTCSHRRQSFRNSRDSTNPSVILSPELKRDKRLNQEKIDRPSFMAHLKESERHNRDGKSDIGERIRQLTQVDADDEEVGWTSAMSLLLPIDTSSNNNNNSFKSATSKATDISKTTKKQLGPGDLLLLAMDEAKAEADVANAIEEPDLIVMEDSPPKTVADSLLTRA